MRADVELARLCGEAYLPEPTVMLGDDLAANVVDLVDARVIAFRGTANVKGWLRNLDAVPKSHDKLGYCHHGFLAGGVALWQHLEPDEDRPLILTGHSLGGALAIIVGALRIVSGQRVDRLVTFGAPRAGYQTLVDIWSAVPDRAQYWNGNDPVTGVPPLTRLAELIFHYRHVAALTHIGSNDPAEPWNCHNIRMYAAYVADVPEPKTEPQS